MKFKKDCEKLITNGVLVPKNGVIRFIFKNNNVFNASIDELDLSVRASNCLKRSHIMTINDIGNMWENLHVIKNMGQKTVKEIKNKYIKYYYNNLSVNEREEFWADTIKATANIGEN